MTSSAQANTTTATEQRIEALAKSLGVEPSEITACTYDECSFEYGRKSYLVLTSCEADALVAERIRDSLWAFNASFIASHTRNGLSRECIKALEEMQGKLCESANPIVEALIEDMDDFVSDAISADGRGHFLSSYDGEENEEGDFFIYRDN
jgi:hypothetical protein